MLARRCVVLLDTEYDADGLGPPGKAVTSTVQEEIYNGDFVGKDTNRVSMGSPALHKDSKWCLSNSVGCNEECLF